MVNLGVTGTVTARMALMSWVVLITPAPPGSSSVSPREYVSTKVSLTKNIAAAGTEDFTSWHCERMGIKFPLSYSTKQVT